MHHDLGGDTRDHITLGHPHPAEHGLPTTDTEANILRYSHKSLTAGITIIVATYLTTLAVSLLTTGTTGDSPFDSPTSRLFAVMGFSALQILGLALILIAGLERITRQQRTLTRLALARADSNTELLTANRRAIDTANRLTSESLVQMEAVEKRLAGLETAMAEVPGYADGLDRGARVAASVLGLGGKD